MVIITPALAAPDVGDTLSTTAAVVVRTSAPEAGPATVLRTMTNILVPYVEPVPVVMHVISVELTHVGLVHVCSRPVAPYVIAGTDEDRPKPVPVSVTVWL